MNLSQFFKLVLILLVAAMLTSCKKDGMAKKEVEHFVQQIEQASQTAQQQVTTDVVIKPVFFDSKNKRDPFEIPAIETTGKAYSNAILSDTSLDTLKLVGVVLDSNEHAALFRANDGKLYKINAGMHVGIQQALLSKITQDKVVFVVEVNTDLGTDSHEVVMTVQGLK